MEIYVGIIKPQFSTCSKNIIKFTRIAIIECVHTSITSIILLLSLPNTYFIIIHKYLHRNVNTYLNMNMP